MLDLRIESRFKNANLYNTMLTFSLAAALKRQSKWYPPPLVEVFGEMCKVPTNTIRKLLNLATDPWAVRKGLCQPARRICEATGEDPEYLFPRHLYRLALPTVAVHVADSVKMVSLSEASSVAVSGVAQIEGAIENADRFAGLEEWMRKNLTPLEEKVIRLRFGFEGEEKTPAEIARKGEVSKKVIYAIEARAMAKLRKPGAWELLSHVGFENKEPS